MEADIVRLLAEIEAALEQRRAAPDSNRPLTPLLTQLNEACGLLAAMPRAAARLHIPDLQRLIGLIEQIETRMKHAADTGPEAPR